MLSILAQVEPPPAVLAQWIQVLMYLGGFACTLIGGAVGVKMLRAKETATPQPFVVTAHQDSATQQQLKEVHGRIARERLEIDKAIEERRQETQAVNARLDREIKDLRDDVVDVPRQVVALLRETKGLLG
jgi:hypothetical protein